MDQLWLNINTALSTASMVDWANLAKIVFELVIIGYGLIWIWWRIKGTQAERLVKGIVVIAMLCILSWIFRLELITTLLQQLIPVAVVSLVIIFQPEIRRGLGYLGKTTFRVDLSLADRQEQRTTEVIGHVISAVRELAKNKVGALIVIEPPEGERDYLSPGTTINAEVSANLIISIFMSKSPLHDGALVIRSDKIVAAGVILPITENPKVSYRYGTRHRAALGLSEIYDGLGIVVSEETGAISAANRGMLVRYNTAEELADPLSYFYHHPSETIEAPGPYQSFLALFGKTADTESGGTEVNPEDEAATPPAVPEARVSSLPPTTPTEPTQALDVKASTDHDTRSQTSTEPV